MDTNESFLDDPSHRIAIGDVLMWVALLAIAVCNYGLSERWRRLENHVREIRDSEKILHVEDASRVAVIAKPRVRFGDLKYELYIPAGRPMELVADFAANANSSVGFPQVHSLVAGRHTIELSMPSWDTSPAQELATRSSQTSAENLAISCWLDGRSIVVMPVQLETFLRLDPTLRYRSLTTYGTDEAFSLLDQHAAGSIRLMIRPVGWSE